MRTVGKIDALRVSAMRAKPEAPWSRPVRTVGETGITFWACRVCMAARGGDVFRNRDYGTVEQHARAEHGAR